MRQTLIIEETDQRQVFIRIPGDTRTVAAGMIHRTPDGWELLFRSMDHDPMKFPSQGLALVAALNHDWKA